MTPTRTPSTRPKAKRKRAKSDGGLTGAVLDYLAMQPDVWAERRNSGGQLVPNRDGSYRSIVLGEPGTPDVTGYLRFSAVIATPAWEHLRCFAVPFGIETKSKNGKLNPNQKRWHAKAAEFGIPCCVARSISEAKAFIERLRPSGRAAR